MIWSLAWLLGCASPPATPEMKMVELPPFEDAAIAELYPSFASWADSLGWKAGELKRRGPRLARVWKRGDPGRQRLPKPDTSRLQLAVFASSKAEQSYGLAWTAATRTSEGDGVVLRMAAAARMITPDQLRIDLHQGESPPVELGAPLTWKVGERVVQTARPAGLDAVVAKYRAYVGDAFAEAASSDLDHLEGAVKPILTSQDYAVCDYGPSPGNGIPGPCLPRVPTQTEAAENMRIFEAEMVRRRTALERAAYWSTLLGTVTP